MIIRDKKKRIFIPPLRFSFHSFVSGTNRNKNNNNVFNLYSNFKLQQCLLLASSSQVKEVMEDQLKSEMAVDEPNAMKKKIHFLKLYIDCSRVKEAFAHMTKIEALKVFSQEVDWYECVLDVLEAFQQTSNLKTGPEFYQKTLNALDRLELVL